MRAPKKTPVTTRPKPTGNGPKVEATSRMDQKTVNADRLLAALKTISEILEPGTFSRSAHIVEDSPALDNIDSVIFKAQAGLDLFAGMRKRFQRRNK